MTNADTHFKPNPARMARTGRRSSAYQGPGTAFGGQGEVMITELTSGAPLPAVPEPSSLAMVGTGLAGLAGLAAMRRRSKT